MLRDRPTASLMDDLHTYGMWPSYVGLTFLVLDDSMDELEMGRLLVHHHLVLRLFKKNVRAITVVSKSLQ